MDTERVQVSSPSQEGGTGTAEGDALNIGTPSDESSVLSASSPSVWATPDLLPTSEKVYSFREIISIPAHKIDEVGNGEESAAGNTNGFITLQSETATNGVPIHSHKVMCSSVYQEKCETVDLPEPGSNDSPRSSHLAAPPNTPQILIENVSFTPSDNDITVYEKTPFGVEARGHPCCSSGVKIIGSIGKINQDPAEVSEKANGEPEKGLNKTYIVPEAVEGVVEGPVEPVDVVGVSATPFDPDFGTLAPAEDLLVDAVDGSTQPASVNAPNNRSQTVVAGFTDDSERLVSEGPDCDELLGGFLVRPCPSMRPFKKRFAKGFLVGLLVVTVAFIIFMIMINRS